MGGQGYLPRLWNISTRTTFSKTGETVFTQSDGPTQHHHHSSLIPEKGDTPQPKPGSLPSSPLNDKKSPDVKGVSKSSVTNL